MKPLSRDASSDFEKEKNLAMSIWKKYVSVTVITLLDFYQK